MAQGSAISIIVELPSFQHFDTKYVSFHGAELLHHGLCNGAKCVG